MTDRGFWLVGLLIDGNVRRLMYQPLIWGFTVLAILRDDAGSLRATLHAEDRKGLADALVNGVRGYAELGSDLFRRQMPVDEAQASELSGGQPAYAACHLVLASGFILTPGGVIQDRRLL